MFIISLSGIDLPIITIMSLPIVNLSYFIIKCAVIIFIIWLNPINFLFDFCIKCITSIISDVVFIVAINIDEIEKNQYSVIVNIVFMLGFFLYVVLCIMCAVCIFAIL